MTDVLALHDAGVALAFMQGLGVLLGVVVGAVILARLAGQP